MNVLVVDVGGTNVKILATGHKEPRRFASGPAMTPALMAAGVRKLAGDWNYNAVAIGYPGLVVKGRIALEPHNLGPGWVGFDFKAAFKRPVKVINDAAMQALGSYRKGTMLFLGGRQRQGTEGSARWLPPWRQCPCLPRWLSTLGEGRHPVPAPSSGKKERDHELKDITERTDARCYGFTNRLARQELVWPCQ